MFLRLNRPSCSKFVGNDCIALSRRAPTTLMTGERAIIVRRRRPGFALRMETHPSILYELDHLGGATLAAPQRAYLCSP